MYIYSISTPQCLCVLQLSIMDLIVLTVGYTQAGCIAENALWNTFSQRQGYYSTLDIECLLLNWFKCYSYAVF